MTRDLIGMHAVDLICGGVHRIVGQYPDAASAWAANPDSWVEILSVNGPGGCEWVALEREGVAPLLRPISSIGFDVEED